VRTKRSYPRKLNTYERQEQPIPMGALRFKITRYVHALIYLPPPPTERIMLASAAACIMSHTLICAVTNRRALHTDRSLIFLRLPFSSRCVYASGGGPGVDPRVEHESKEARNHPKEGCDNTKLESGGQSRFHIGGGSLEGGVVPWCSLQSLVLTRRVEGGNCSVT
jgi:hypothetical protein